MYESEKLLSVVPVLFWSTSAQTKSPGVPEPIEPTARSVSGPVVVLPKLYSAPALLEPSLPRYNETGFQPAEFGSRKPVEVVPPGSDCMAYQPSSVALFVHVGVPLVASVSKSCEY